MSCDSAATCVTVLDTLQFCRLRKTATVLQTTVALRIPQLRSSLRFSADLPVEMPRGGQYASYHIDGGFDEGVDHRTP